MIDIEFPVERWDDNRPEEEFTLFAISQHDAVEFSNGVAGLSQVVAQMGQIMIQMQHRLDQLEEKERMITLSHAEVRILQGMIRARAADYCEKYRLSGPANLRRISAGIKKAILNRYAVKDLHDVPAIARQAVENQIERWSDVRLMMKCRDAGGGA